MSRARTTGPVMVAPTHSHPEGLPCFVMNECAIHTVTLPEGAFSAIVHACEGPTGGVAVIAILDHDEVEEHIRLLRNAVEDAKRLDNGLKPVDRSGPGREPDPRHAELVAEFLDFVRYAADKDEDEKREVSVRMIRAIGAALSGAVS